MYYALVFLTIITGSIFGLKYNKNVLCKNCKWFMPNTNYNTENDCGFCKMFPNKIFTDKEEIILYDYAEHCRKDEYLCGEEGYFFENKYFEKLNEKLNENLNKISQEQQDIDSMLDEYYELESRFSVEVLEKDEIREIEETMNYLLEQITNFYLEK
jgi:hypothetical protein